MVESLLSMRTTRLVSTGRCTQRQGHPRKGTPKDGGTQGRVHPEAGTPKKGCTQRQGLIHNGENMDPSTELLPQLLTQKSLISLFLGPLVYYIIAKPEGTATSLLGRHWEAGEWISILNENRVEQTLFKFFVVIFHFLNYFLPIICDIIINAFLGEFLGFRLL